MKLKYLLFLLFFVTKIYSSFVGNPSLPAILQEGFIFSDVHPVNVRVGFFGSTIANERIRFKRQFRNDSFNTSKFKGRLSVGTVTLNLFERIDISAQVGSGIYQPEFKYQDRLYQGKSKDGIYLNGAAKIILLEVGPCTASIDGQYQMFKADGRYLLRNKNIIDEPSLKYYFKQWQVGAGLSAKVFSMIPYIGFSVKDMNFKMKHLNFYSKRLTLKERHRAGLYIGSSVNISTKLIVDYEFSFINEMTASISGKARF